MSYDGPKVPQNTYTNTYASQVCHTTIHDRHTHTNTCTTQRHTYPPTYTYTHSILTWTQVTSIQIICWNFSNMLIKTLLRTQIIVFCKKVPRSFENFSMPLVLVIEICHAQVKNNSYTEIQSIYAFRFTSNKQRTCP